MCILFLLILFNLLLEANPVIDINFIFLLFKYLAALTIFLEFPDALMNQMGWDIGDKLIWNELPGGDWKLHLEKTDEDTDNGIAGVGQDSSS